MNFGTCDSVSLWIRLQDHLEFEDPHSHLGWGMLLYRTLSDASIVGTLPPAIGNLSDLVTLWVGKASLIHFVLLPTVILTYCIMWFSIIYYIHRCDIILHSRFQGLLVESIPNRRTLKYHDDQYCLESWLHASLWNLVMGCWYESLDAHVQIVDRKSKP